MKKNIHRSQDEMDKMLLAFGREHTQIPREDRIKETVQTGIELISKQEEGETLSYASFFYMQVKMIQKRWWVLQGIILMLAWLALDISEVSESVQRAMGIAAALFVILIMPEMWKNRETNSMEIEKAAFYSLRQIYSAKLLAFGFVDACILNIFCFAAVNMHQMPLYDLLKQFIFPLMMSTGICFAIFCSNKRFSEVSAVFACAIANGLWTLLVINEAVYTKITPLLWGLLFAISGSIVFFSIRKTICDCDNLWEVSRNGINIG